jgi:Ino eighty subunit 1
MSRRPSPQPVHKKTVPYCVKRNDGDPITRNDLQYDLLHHIFSDEHAVFTDPNPTLRGDPPGTKTTFHDLYINALIRSPRASKVLREKMLDTPEFGTDFAKLSLLANVGRINTTMACESSQPCILRSSQVLLQSLIILLILVFPEMKTAIRTYHPIPALQKTNGNLQDAPRIKNILKSCLLDGESKAGVPSTPVDILSRSVRTATPF